MVTVWSKRARLELQKAYLYIQMDSVQNAEMLFIFFPCVVIVRATSAGDYASIYRRSAFGDEVGKSRIGSSARTF